MLVSISLLVDHSIYVVGEWQQTNVKTYTQELWIKYHFGHTLQYSIMLMLNLELDQSKIFNPPHSTSSG